MSVGDERRREEGICLYHWDLSISLFACLVCFFTYLKLSFGEIFTVFEVLEKNLEASFYFSVLEKKTMEKLLFYLV